jgi:hypothetical protein
MGGVAACWCCSAFFLHLSSVAHWRAAISSRARRFASTRTGEYRESLGARDVPGDAHDHFVTSARFGVDLVVFSRIRAALCQQHKSG